MAYIFVYAIFCNFPSYTFGAWSAQKKREVRLLFTLFKGFAIPVLSRKTTEVHARYVQPFRPQYGRGLDITYPHGHSLLLSRLVTKCCEDSIESQTTSINAFYYVLLFNVSE